MAGNASIVAKLLSLGANPLPLDKIDRSPLYYVELTEDETIKEMITTAAKVENLPNLSEMRRVLHPRLPHGKEPVALLQTDVKQIVPLTAAKFRDMTNLSE